MARRSASLLALALAAMTALGLSACGSGDGADLLPGSTASEITANLDQVRELVGEGECIGAEDAANEVSEQVDALEGVDKRLKQALHEGAARLTLVVEECEEAPEEETEPAIEPAVEPEAEEKKEKAEKPVKEKPEKEAEEEPEATTPTLPPQAEGKAKGHEKPEEEEPPVVESEEDTSSGGVGPGAAVEGE